MRGILAVVRTCIAVLVIAALGTDCASTRTKGRSQADRVKLVGTFDPYEARDGSNPDTVVMKPRPNCGSCHAQGMVYRDAQGLPRLSLSVHYDRAEKKPSDWDLAGKQEPEGIVFTKPKFRLVYSQGALRGDFRGRMNATIQLKQAVPKSRP